MTTPRPESRAQRSATRAPVGRPINLQFDDSMDVVDGVCENISIGGMFIQVVNTRPPGSLVRFELQIDDSIAIRGLGEVVWNRAENEVAVPSVSGKNEPGMGIKFRFLEQRDRQLIFKLVSQHIKDRLTKQQPPSIDDEFPIDPPAPAPPAPAVAPPAADAGAAASAYDTATVTAPMATDGPHVVDVVVNDPPPLGSSGPSSFDLDDEEPTVIGQRFDEEPTIVGQRTTVLPAITTPPESPPSVPSFESPAPPISPSVSPPALESFAEAPLAPPAPTSFVEDPPPRSPVEPEHDALSDSFDSNLARLRGTPLSGELPSVDHGLDRGDAGGSGPSDFGEAPFDNLLGGSEGHGPTHGMAEYSVDDGYDLDTEPARRRPVAAVAALVLVTAIAAGYWFRDEIFGLFGNDAVETAFGPATVGGSETPAPTGAPESTPPVTREAPAAATSTGSNTTTSPPPSAGRSQTPPPPTTRPGPPPPPPPRASARPATTGGFSKVADIRWQAAPEGLRVIIETDGAVPAGRWRQFRLGGDSPREVIRLLGVRSPYGSSQIAVGHPVLRQIRTGYHRKSAGNELHVVLDLADPRVEAGDVRVSGDRLEVVLSAP